jgi:hypothetical protein
MTDTDHQHTFDIPEGSYSIAFVIDGVVQDVLHTDTRLAAIFLSQPEIVDVTDWYAAREDKTKNLVGSKYENETFTAPETIEEDSVVGSSITPRMNPSFVWNNDLQTWQPPIPYPTDDKNYRWDEETISWVEIEGDIESIVSEMGEE